MRGPASSSPAIHPSDRSAWTGSACAALRAGQALKSSVVAETSTETSARLSLAAIGLAIVAMLERRYPYEPAWRHDHVGTQADATHALVNFGLLLIAVELLFALRGHIWHTTLWPQSWPVALQILLAGTIIDLGIYLVHRCSHRTAWLWALHAPHHSPERLYWLNGERRHPLHALLMAGPGHPMRDRLLDG